jgi:hypothetical protein
MRVSALFHSNLANEKTRVSALAQKNVRTIVYIKQLKIQSSKFFAL